MRAPWKSEKNIRNLAITIALSFLAPICFGRDVKVGRLCVMANYEDASTPTLKVGALVSLHITAKGLSGCVSGGEYSGPKVTPVEKNRWEVTGNFVPTGSKVLEPDCGGSVKSTTLGRLPAGKYQVKSENGKLEFTIPTSSREVCIEVR